MYQVIEFKLLPGLDVVLKGYNPLLSSMYESRSGMHKTISIKVPDSGDQDISLMRYLVGERITFRKSLTGLKLIRGLPDYSGVVDRVDLTEKLPQLVQDRKDRHIRNMHQRDSYIRASNLCMEIPMPGGSDWEPTVDWTSVRESMGPIQGEDRSVVTEMLEASRARMYESLRNMGSGTVTGRTRGLTLPVIDDAYQQELANMLAAYSQFGTRSLYYQRGGRVGRQQNRTELSRRFSGTDFDGDAMMAIAEAVPTRYVDNRDEISPVDLTSAVMAARELTEGERARPPQSRGPRPRNQRW